MVGGLWATLRAGLSPAHSDKTKLLRVYGHVNKEFDSVSRLPDLDIESINDVIDVLEDSPEEMPSISLPTAEH